jgi:hypothetical protein
MFFDGEKTEKEGTEFASGVHAHLRDLFSNIRLEH